MCMIAIQCCILHIQTWTNILCCQHKRIIFYESNAIMLAICPWRVRSHIYHNYTLINCTWAMSCLWKCTQLTFSNKHHIRIHHHHYHLWVLSVKSSARYIHTLWGSGGLDKWIHITEKWSEYTGAMHTNEFIIQVHCFCIIQCKTSFLLFACHIILKISV